MLGRAAGVPRNVGGSKAMSNGVHESANDPLWHNAFAALLAELLEAASLPQPPVAHPVSKGF